MSNESYIFNKINILLPNGKYKGQSVSYVYSIHPSYIKWYFDHVKELNEFIELQRKYDSKQGD